MSRVSVMATLIAALAITCVTSAATMCSIQPDKNATEVQLAKLAKVSQTAAEKRALAHVKVPAKVLGSELQVIDGCLVWSLVVKQSGKSAIQALNVDAGTGKVLLAQREVKK